MRWAETTDRLVIEGAMQAAAELVSASSWSAEDERPLHAANSTGHDERITIRHAPQVVEMHESLRRGAKKRDSSIWVATELVKSGRPMQGEPGNTGASMVSAFSCWG